MQPLLLIAGPCVIENDTMPLRIAERLKKICEGLPVQLVFKASYRKANRTRLDSFTGIDFEKALRILEQVKQQLQLPVLTDVHETVEVNEVATVVDYLQIPAFLCRQTDLLLACGESGCHVNVKKGQFASPDSMRYAVEKVRSTGNSNVLLTERGTTFGYGDLVVDFRGIATMQQLKVPVVLDATHSLQQPNQSSGITGGQPKLIETMCKAGIAVGVDGLFIETHPDPASALSDGANMLPIDQLPSLLGKCLRIRQVL